MSRVLPDTVFARSIRLLFAAGALFILIYSALQPVTGIAQPVDGTRKSQSAWSKLCFDAPYVQSNVESGLSKLPSASETMNACFTYVENRDQPTGILMGFIGVLQAPALDRTLLVALLPLGSALPPEPGYLLLQDGSRIKLSYLQPPATCDQSGCYARAELSEGLLESIKTATALSFGNDGWEPQFSYTTLLACCRFAEAFAGQPVRPSAYDETQRKVIEVLVRRFHDFIQ